MTLTTEEPLMLREWPDEVEVPMPHPPPRDPAVREEPSPDAASLQELPPPLTSRLELARLVLVAVFALSGGLVLQLTLVSSVQQRSDQQQLYDDFRVRLAEGTAPVGPADPAGVVYPLGTPVAYLDIPEISLSQVVVSGTSSEALFSGPGHRRDTVLPGQAGATIIMGRRASYGGPFGSLDQLEEDDRIMVTTGQGEFEYRVTGVRREGDPVPPPIEAGESRLVLTTAAGPPFAPNGVLRVDASMQGAEAGPGRLFITDSLPGPEDTMAGDTTELWALVLWLQALTIVSLGSVWAWHRWGRAQAWVVFLPPLMLVGIAVSNQAARLLPNLL
jgi:LPXTG-site transpeptidase (sortase) family protein